MDNYNNMIGNQYGNIYGGDLHQNQLLHQQQQQQQQHQQQQQIGDGMLMQGTGHDMKNLSYGARESIIASNMDQHQPINYQQQQHMHHHQAMEQQQPMPIPPEMHVIQHQQQQQQHVPMETLHQPPVVQPESVIQHSTQESSVILQPVGQPMEEAIPEQPEVKIDGALAVVSDAVEDKKVDAAGTPSENAVDIVVNTEEKAAEVELKNGEEVKADDVSAVPEPTEPKKPEIDPQQCRVCMAKEDLVDIFQFENVFRINDLIMKICPTVRISERDFLPHLICTGCIGKVKIAYELKTTCENTEKEYRSNLKRSRNKSRTTASDYVLVNAPDFSESEDDEEIQDEEFKISGSEEASEVDSDESFEIDSRKRRSKPRRRSAPSRRRTQKKSSSGSAPSSKRSSSNSTRSRVESAKKFKPDIVYIEANNDSSEEEDSDDATLKKSVNNNSSKRKPPTNRSTPAAPTPKATVARKAPEPKQVPTCHICNKTFVKRSSLKAHVERHNDPPTVDCDVCHRTFSSKGRMERHSCQAKPKARRPPTSTPARTAVEQPTAAGSTGRDLFKTVAPVTSTYWSDDFSD
jgi:PR domain zinc finger protein 5